MVTLGLAFWELPNCFLSLFIDINKFTSADCFCKSDFSFPVEAVDTSILDFVLNSQRFSMWAVNSQFQ